MISLSSLLVGVSDVGRLVVAAVCATVLLRAFARPSRGRTWARLTGGGEFLALFVLFFFLFSALVAAIHGGSR